MRYCVFVLVMGCLFSCSHDNSPNSPDLETSEITIGALLPLTAGGPIQGDAVLSAVNTAKNDLNDILASRNSPYRIALDTIDTENNPDLYISGLQDFHERGITFVITSSTSATLSILKSYADQLDVILIEQGSTSPELAGQDNIFRMIPNDNILSDVLSDALVSHGIEHLVTLHRGDVWGEDLSILLEEKFEQAGGDQYGTISYDGRMPLDAIDSALDQLNTAVSAAAAAYGADKVGVEFISFEEGIEYLAAASDYPALRAVKWFGSDGMTLNADIISDAAAAGFAAAVGFASPQFGESGSADYLDVKAAVETEIGRTAYSLATVAYDAFMLAAETLVDNPAGEITALKSALFDIVSEYEGITGAITFDVNGDRVSEDYDFWGIESAGGSYNWVKLY